MTVRHATAARTAIASQTQQPRINNKPFLPNAVVYMTAVCDRRRFRDRSRCRCAHGNEIFGFLESKSLPQLMPEQQEICAHLKNDRPNREIPDLPNLESRHT